MVDDYNKKKADEDEYQFPQDEYIQPNASETSQAEEEMENEGGPPPVFQTERASLWKNKRIIAVIVVAAIALVVFHFMHRDNPTVLQNTTQSTTQPTVQSMNTVSPSQLDALRSQQITDESTLSQLQSQMQQLQASIASLSENQDKMVEIVQDLSNQLKNLSTKKTAILVKPMKLKKHTPYVKPVYYHTKAIIPGRAWVVGSDGSSQTVSTGDFLTPRYGKILSMDTATGRINTSSGLVIRYGSDDS